MTVNLEDRSLTYDGWSEFPPHIGTEWFRLIELRGFFNEVSLLAFSKQNCHSTTPDICTNPDSRPAVSGRILIKHHLLYLKVSNGSIIPNVLQLPQICRPLPLQWKNRPLDGKILECAPIEHVLRAVKLNSRCQAMPRAAPH